MDVEVLGLEHLEIEGAVLDLVLAEVVLRGECGGNAAEQHQRERETTNHEHTRRFRRRA